MRRLLSVGLLLAVVGPAAASNPVAQGATPAPQDATTIAFQPAGRDRFSAPGENFGLMLRPVGATIAFTTRSASRQRRPRLRGFGHLTLVGANRTARATPLSPLPGETTFAVGSDPRKWQTGRASYGAVLYRNVYRGIDARYEGKARSLKVRFTIRPGARPSQIRIATERRKPMVRLQVVAHQVDGKTRRAVRSRLVTRRPGRYALRLSGWDRTQPLIAELTAVTRWRLLYGGDAATDIAVDENGAAYVAGASWRVWIDEEGGPGWARAFVASLTKVSPEGQKVFTTYLNGGGALGVAIDSTGAAYLTGVAYLDDFPVSKNAFQRHPGASEIADAFVTKIDPTGRVVYSTRLGGGRNDQGSGIDVDAAGNAYVTGATRSGPEAPFPTTPGALRTRLELHDYWDAFVTKVDPSGSSLEFSTYLGGSYYDVGWAIAATADGGAVVAGEGGFAECWPSCDPDAHPFPTTPGAYQEEVRHFHDAFVTRLDSRGSRLVYSTLLGGDGTDAALDLALAPDGTAWVAGRTFPGYGPPFGNDFPTTPTAFQRNWPHTAAIGAGFVSAIAAEGTTLAYSSFIAGTSGGEVAESLSLDADGNVWVVGGTNSSDFPTTPDAIQRRLGGRSDGFLLSPMLDRPGLRYSTLLGGLANEVLVGVGITPGRGSVVGNGSVMTWPYSKTPFLDPFAEATGNGFLKSFAIPR